LGIIDEIARREPVEAVQRLGYIIGWAHNPPWTAEAVERLVTVPGWQEIFETLALEVKQSWDGRTMLKRPPQRLPRGDHLLEGKLWNILRGVATNGYADAVLISAPLLFDTTEMIAPGEHAPPSVMASTVMVFADRDYVEWTRRHEQDGEWHQARIAACRWWVAQAKKFGAEPPSSEYASFEEVLELCRVARRANPNARFPRRASLEAAPHKAAALSQPDEPSQTSKEGRSSSKDAPAPVRDAELPRARAGGHYRQREVILWCVGILGPLAIAALLGGWLRSRTRKGP